MLAKGSHAWSFDGPAAAMRELIVRQRTMLINAPSFKRTAKAQLSIVG
jgi:hypothetical protein